ncbi:MAG: sulfatase [Fuerstiella sp.]
MIPSHLALHTRLQIELVLISLILLQLTSACSPVLAQQAESRPNILFCISDDQSWKHAGAYGCDWVKTPAFDQVAADGLLFQRAYTPNAKCAPSRACILTGRNSWQLEAACNHWCFFPSKFGTWPEALAQNGYHVGMTGKGWAPGIANDSDGKKRQMTGRNYSRKRSKPPTQKISPNDYAANFDVFLSDQKADQPFCFWYGCTEPHRAYEYGTGVRVGGKSIEQIDEVPPFWPDNKTVRNDMLDYALEIEHFDTHLGRMLKSLQDKGQLENTIVIVTADNGMPFPRIKGQEYEFSNHLPLAIMWKKGIRNPGRKIDDYVSFIDFAPTVIEAAGLNWKQLSLAATSGKSLMPVFADQQNSAVHRDFVVFGKERHDIGRPDDQGYPIRGIVSDGWIFLKNYETSRWPSGNPETGYLNCDGSPTKTVLLNERRHGPDTAGFWKMSFGKRPEFELYDANTDPYCMQNLASRAMFDEQQRHLEAILMATLKAQQDPRLGDDPTTFERMPYANQQGHDFFNRYQKGEKLNAGWVNPSDFETVPIEDE